MTPMGSKNLPSLSWTAGWFTVHGFSLSFAPEASLATLFEAHAAPCSALSMVLSSLSICQPSDNQQAFICSGCEETLKLRTAAFYRESPFQVRTKLDTLLNHLKAGGQYFCFC